MPDFVSKICFSLSFDFRVCHVFVVIFEQFDEFVLISHLIPIKVKVNSKPNVFGGIHLLL